MVILLKVLDEKKPRASDRGAEQVSDEIKNYLSDIQSDLQYVLAQLKRSKTLSNVSQRLEIAEFGGSKLNLLTPKIHWTKSRRHSALFGPNAYSALGMQTVQSD
jgi:hypothetical protein